MKRVAFVVCVVVGVLGARLAVSAALPGDVTLERIEWSPTRAEIAFWATVDEQTLCGSGKREKALFVVRPDGSELRRVDWRRSDGHVWYDVDDVMDRVWSPDGSKLAFTGLDAAGPHGIGDRYVQVVARTGEPVAYTGYAEPTEWAPDSQRLAVLLYDPIAEPSGPAIFNLQSVHEQKIGLFFSSYARWSPRGTLVAYQHNDYLFVQRPNGKDRHRLAKGGAGEDDSVAGWPEDLWSGDGKLLAFVHSKKHDAPHAYVIQPDGRNMRRMPEDPGFWVWAPRGETYAFGGDVYDLKTGRLWHTVPRTINPEIPAWSPNGRRLAYPTDDRSIFIVDRDGRHGHKIRLPKAILPPTLSEDLSGLSWSADSRTLALATEDGLYVIGADGLDGHYVPLDLCEALTAHS